MGEEKVTLRYIRQHGAKGTSTSLYARLVSRRISPIFTYIFLRTKTTPNTVTLLCIASGVAVGALLSQKPSTLNSLSIVLFGLLWHVLDCSDGEVARLSGRTSRRGEFLDLIGHYVVDYSFVTGLAFRFILLQEVSSVWVAATLMLVPFLFIYQKIVRQCETLVSNSDRVNDEPSKAPGLSVTRSLTRMPWSNTGFVILVSLASIYHVIAYNVGAGGTTVFAYLFYFYLATLPFIILARLGLSLRRISE